MGYNLDKHVTRIKTIVAPKRLFPQTVTWWARSASDEYGGSLFNPPKVIGARWEDKNVIYRNREGNEATSNAIVYVDRDVEVGDYLALGESESNDPHLVDAYEIMKYSKSPDIRNLTSSRKVIL